MGCRVKFNGPLFNALDAGVVALVGVQSQGCIVSFEQRASLNTRSDSLIDDVVKPPTASS
jgi:hypothetical protein